jgi:hypothetical protein
MTPDCDEQIKLRIANTHAPPRIESTNASRPLPRRARFSETKYAATAAVG